ncbi:MAG TPA: 50S ribosomal protein L24 [candidate division WWE3 bacterium]|uniref:Large ribosomal subunit protein uL24 n=1 Tax=candidate division WWE3 bacterium TaxID=2053526 RepID=A0A7C1DM25_UNCKA|nr:50S ribosomal protein L24 [candidate division WWE3 bacterium]
MKIRKGDKVKVISGKDRGKISQVLKVLKDANKVVVEGVHVVKKNVKPGKVGEQGGIVEMEKPIDVSNVMFYNESLGKAVRIGFKFIDGKKYRICKKSGEVLDLKKEKDVK